MKKDSLNNLTDSTEVPAPTTQVIQINKSWKEIKEEEHRKIINEFISKFRNLCDEYHIKVIPQLTITSEGTKSQLLFEVVE